MEPTPQDVHIDTTDGNRKRKKRKPMPDKAEILLDDIPIWKNDAQQNVYGIVLEPNLEDSQGDIITPEEIEKSAHRYLVESRKQDVQHSTNPAAVYPVESYIAPHDMLLHGQLVKRGAWVLVCKVADPEVWAEVVEKGLTGYSIQGSGVRIPA